MGGGKGGPQAIYKPKTTGILEGALFGSAIDSMIQANPNMRSLLDAPGTKEQLGKIGLSPEMISGMAPQTKSVDYEGLLKEANALPTASVKPSTWTPDANFQFKTPEYTATTFKPQTIEGITGDVFNRQRDQVFEDISRDSKRASEASRVSLAKTGLGRSGFVGGAQADIDRGAREATSRASRDINAQQAASGVDVAKYNSGMNMQAQQAQAQENKFQSELSRWQQQQQGAENLSRSNLNLQGAGQNFNQAMSAQDSEFNKIMQKLGITGSLQNQRASQSEKPYQMLSSLYGTNTGIPIASGGGGKGDPFSAILGAAGSIAPMFCLPTGTAIDLEDGSQMPVQEIRVGQKVKGGTVIATVTKRRHDGHRFYLHEFKDGTSVVMSLGHPYFGEIEKIIACEHDSLCTNDILTDSGYYFSNSCKLGSTIR